MQASSRLCKIVPCFGGTQVSSSSLHLKANNPCIISLFLLNFCARDPPETLPSLAKGFLARASHSRMAQPVDIVVFGAGGPTGREVVRAALSQGLSVRAAVRDPAKHQPALSAIREALPATGKGSLEVVAADVTQPETLPAALSGAAGAVFAASGSSYFEAAKVDCAGVAAVAAASVAAGVKRMVLVSSQLVSPHNFWHPMRLILSLVKWNLMDEKWRGEQVRPVRARRIESAIQSSLRSGSRPPVQALRSTPGLSYTIVRPGRLSDGPAGATAWRVGQGDLAQRAAAIPRADVAAVCVAALLDPKAHRVTMEIAGASPPEPAVEGQLQRIFDGLVADAFK